MVFFFLFLFLFISSTYAGALIILLKQITNRLKMTENIKAFSAGTEWNKADIEDPARVVISYTIYETGLRRVSYFLYEMTMSVRFRLSYVPLNWDLIAFWMNIVSIRKHISDMDVVNDVICTRQVLLQYGFYDMTLSTE